MVSLLKHLSPIALLFTVAMAFAAYDSALRMEQDDAQAALTAAAASDAALYAPDLFLAAIDSMAAATMEIERQTAHAVFSRDYTRARSLLAVVTTMAADATAKAPSGKEAARQEATALIARADLHLATVQALLAQTPQVPADATAFVTRHTDTAQVLTLLTEARTALDASAFAHARDLAGNAASQAQRLVTEMTPAGIKARI